jgi:hypothetical protein
VFRRRIPKYRIKVKPFLLRVIQVPGSYWLHGIPLPIYAAGIISGGQCATSNMARIPTPLCIVIPDHHKGGTIMGNTITETSQGVPGTMESLLLTMGECMGFLTPEVLDQVANLFVSQM